MIVSNCKNRHAWAWNSITEKSWAPRNNRNYDVSVLKKILNFLPATNVRRHRATFLKSWAWQIHVKFILRWISWRHCGYTNQLTGMSLGYLPNVKSLFILSHVLKKSAYAEFRKWQFDKKHQEMQHAQLERCDVWNNAWKILQNECSWFAK